MRIIAFANPNAGPSYHRVHVPLMLMDGPDVFITNAPKEEYFEKGCNIFMFNRILPDGALEKMLDLKKKYGFRIVCDVDDWWYLDKHHILYDDYHEQEFAKKQIVHLRAADIVLTTHERLAESIGDVLQLRVDPFHPFVVRPQVYVCPNAIPPEGQFSPQTYALRKMSSPYVRLFWQGSITHRRDIEILEWPIHQLRRIAPKIKMVMAGYHDGDAEWDAMARIYTAGLKHQYQLITGSKATEYYESYQQADICLVPLVNSPFNRMKSNLKILEAANLGLPVVASAVHPYLDMPVNYCRTGRDWEQHIKRLVKWPKRREEEGQRLAEFCKEHYNFHKINNERKQILEYVAAKTV